MRQFYQAFLQWRTDAGMDNGIADHLQDMLQQAGFQTITVTNLSERTVKGDPSFSDDLNICPK
ncbi:hypothetical protein KTO58_01420 [Chitinophaga pendula]|uniref:hypothetical protein n=1 Tax=Chitinophaga TaxID=79328 RepID=UPI0012FE76B5|nr:MULTISPECIES: hypothetical protein [Chitinophaga]UCJ07866.1 hypothetical protein KTO58_01420 [Chitinophaga pendula]